MKRGFCISLSLFLITHLFAQPHANIATTGKIRGKVVDSATSQPIEYASITVFLAGNTKVVSGSSTNPKGAFSIDSLPLGNYKIVIDFIGYKQKEKSNIVISSNRPFVSAGTISLLSSAQTLAGVTVFAQKGLIENKIDKMVYNVEKDVTAQGGVATDILKKVPMVSVDVDGNVELQGNSNILFLINGKPSTIFGNNLADALQSIPASQIKSIEVITSPGAKYDAEGTAGIINIILKNSRVQGINGNVNFSAGSRLENGSFNLNARNGNFGAHAYFSGNAQLLSTTLNGMNRPSFDSTGKSNNLLLQDGQNSFRRNGFETGLSIDWDINKKNNISASIGYDNFGNNSNGYTNQQQIGYDSVGNIASQINNVILANNHFRGRSFDWDLSYKKDFAKEGQELDVLYEASYGRNQSFFLQSQNNSAKDSVQAGSYSNNAGKDYEYSIQADYVHPFSEKVRMETGVKLSIRNITSNTAAFSLDTTNSAYYIDTTQSNSLAYNRSVYAGYVSIAFPFLKFFDLKTGIRYERTKTDASFSEVPEAVIPSYDTWAPSGIVSHTFDNFQTLKFSYTKRIQRPGYRSLNPFVNAIDPQNITQGNPLLKPEIGNNYEFAYIKSFDKGSTLNIVLFYRQSRQDVQPYIVYYPTYHVGDSVYTNVSVNTPENIGTENNYGLNIYGSVPLTPKLNVRTNLSFFDRYIQNAIVAGSNISSFNYRVNMNVSYIFNDNLIFEAFGNFNSPRNEVQGRFPSFTSYNIAFRKQFWKKKGSIGFTTTNPFNKYVSQPTAITGQGFILNSTRMVPYRSFGISFMYKFGKLEFKKEKETNNIPSNPDEGN